MSSVEILRIVVASPSDVKAERDSVEMVAAELNNSIAADRNLRIEVSHWETDAFPGFHADGPQGLIDPILNIKDCDLLIGIFWKRFGTPAMGADSGTEHEFRVAYAAWKETNRPQIMVYFNEKPFAPQTKAETDQWGKVLEFKRSFPKNGMWWPYKGKTRFANLFRNHLTQFIRQHRPATSLPFKPDVTLPPQAGGGFVMEGSPAEGKIGTRFIKDHPIAFIGAGGVAILIIVLLIGYYTYIRPSNQRTNSAIQESSPPASPIGTSATPDSSRATTQIATVSPTAALPTAISAPIAIMEPTSTTSVEPLPVTTPQQSESRIEAVANSFAGRYKLEPGLTKIPSYVGVSPADLLRQDLMLTIDRAARSLHIRIAGSPAHERMFIGVELPLAVGRWNESHWGGLVPNFEEEMRNWMDESGFADGEWDSVQSDSESKAIFWHVPIELVERSHGEWAMVELGIFSDEIEAVNARGKKFIRIIWPSYRLDRETAEAVFVKR